VSTTNHNPGPLDALVDAIAEAVVAKLLAAQPEQRLMDIPAAAKYLGRSVHSVRHLIGQRVLPSVRRDDRVFLDRQDLDAWIEMHKSKG